MAEDVVEITYLVSEEARRAPEEFVAEDVPENHVVSEDVGMLTGVAELNEKSGNPQSHAIRYTQETPTEYNSKRPGTQRKAKAHKKPKKREEDVAEDVAEVTWFLRT